MQDKASDRAPTRPARTMSPARDPKIAVAEEFEIARKRGTAEALALFLLRHPDDPLAEQARDLIKQFEEKRNSR